MKEFLGKDFLLDSEAAKELYYGYAEKMPIYDFHCHLNPKEIYEDKKYRSLTEVWLAGDHYKWRLLRQFGIDENEITGTASDEAKFAAYAKTIPYAIGNPIYSWTHLELRRFFGINDVLTPETADKIYAEANEKLKDLTARKLIKMSNVKGLCTTDDPVDSLEYHILIKEDESFDVVVRPSFRPDKGMKIDQPTFLPWIEELGKVVGYKIDSFATLKKALLQRAYFFDEVGCVCADHGLEPFAYLPSTAEECEAIFAKALKGEALTSDEVEKYKGALLVALGKIYNELGWVQQYHIGALRNNSERNFKKLGPDTGFDAINDQNFAPKLSAVLNELDKTNELPKTVLYCLNPRDNETLAALMNCFQGGIPGKIQFGSGWWFNDNASGMMAQMDAFANLSCLGKFVGMLTDSRSFVSYPRHEYFRRILCNMIGKWVEDGLYPKDYEALKNIVEGICYRNAKEYFKF